MLLWSQSEEGEIDLEHTTVPFSPFTFFFLSLFYFWVNEGGVGGGIVQSQTHTLAADL